MPVRSVKGSLIEDHKARIEQFSWPYIIQVSVYRAIKWLIKLFTKCSFRDNRVYSMDEKIQFMKVQVYSNTNGSVTKIWHWCIQRITRSLC